MPDPANPPLATVETSVVEAFSLHGTAVQCDPDSPLPLIDPGAAFLVTRGHLDIVAMTITREQSATDLSRTHLMRISEGQVLFGLDAPRGGANVLLLGFGSAGAQLYRLPTPRLALLGAQPELRRQLAGLVDRCCLLYTSPSPRD